MLVAHAPAAHARPRLHSTFPHVSEFQPRIEPPTPVTANRAPATRSCDRRLRVACALAGRGCRESATRHPRPRWHEATRLQGRRRNERLLRRSITPSLDFLKLRGEPIEALIQAFSTRRAGRLNVPRTPAQSLRAERRGRDGNTFTCTLSHTSLAAAAACLWSTTHGHSVCS